MNADLLTGRNSVSFRDRGPKGFTCPLSVTGEVIRLGEAKPAAPVLRCGLHGLSLPIEQGVGGGPVDAATTCARNVRRVRRLPHLGQSLGQPLAGKAELQLGHDHPDADEGQDEYSHAQHLQHEAVLPEQVHTANADEREVEDQRSNKNANYGERIAAATTRAHSPRSGSRPTVRPGRDTTPRTASNTPGMNDERCKESWRIVSVSPVPPKSTS